MIGDGMRYYVKELQNNEGVLRTAGIKARDDIDFILEKNGFIPIEMCYAYKSGTGKSVIQNIKEHITMKNNWKKALAHLQKGDSIVFQFPVINHSIFLNTVLSKLRKKGVKVILLVHDLELLRNGKRADVSFKMRTRIRIEEKSILSNCDAIIAHNEKMKQQLISFGIQDKIIVNLEIFDYLIPDFEDKYCADQFQLGLPYIIAGTLRKHKVQYLYKIPQNVPCNLYGVGYEDNGDVSKTYFGSFPPDDLPFAMRGSFGLVWDGTEIDTCSGTYGEYLRINNPHKTSLYLASGIPVVIWDQAALASFIKKNGCGICVSSIQEIPEKVKSLSQEEYENIKQNTLAVSQKLRSGYFTMQAMERCKV